MEPKIDDSSIPTIKVLEDLSKDICTCWETLGRMLGLSEQEMVDIYVGHLQFPSPQSKAFQMLMVWHRQGSHSTYGKLAQALSDIDKSHLAEKYYEKGKWPLMQYGLWHMWVWTIFYGLLQCLRIWSQFSVQGYGDLHLHIQCLDFKLLNDLFSCFFFH